jgi:signal transduction histidine kinase
MKNESFQLYNQPFSTNSLLHEELLNALPILAFVTDKNDRILYVNKCFSNLIDGDLTAGNVSMKEIVNRADWDNWNENLFRLSNLTDVNNSVFIVRFNRPDKSVKYIKLKGKVFKRDEYNKPLSYFFTGEDVTEQCKNKNLSAENESSDKTQMNLMTKSLAEKKLELTVKDLDRSNKDLEEFAYIASHDLQEPLRKISAFSSRLAYKYNEQLGEEGKLYLSKITAAAAGMKELIENLLQISRTVVHSQPFVSTDLDRILNEVKQNLDLKIEERNAQITISNLPVIETLPSQMKQLFNNLLSNALKFSLKDVTPVVNINSLEISLTEANQLKLPEHKTYYKITVKDNGIGFKQEFANNLFKIFYRLNSKSEYPGTGIGLAICKKIVEKHNGLIWAESEAGKGAAFFIVFPKTQDDYS